MSIGIFTFRSAQVNEILVAYLIWHKEVSPVYLLGELFRNGRKGSAYIDSTMVVRRRQRPEIPRIQSAAQGGGDLIGVSNYWGDSEGARTWRRVSPLLIILIMIFALIVIITVRFLVTMAFVIVVLVTIVISLTVWP